MKERILAFNQSKKLSADEVEKVSAAGLTTYATLHGSYGSGGWDSTIDVTIDF